ncbi:MAG: cbb3-type cytochrome oxidase subunit 3 [Gammaproteobacteria bacterium]
MDIGLLRGLLTALVFTAFIGLVFWAYSGRREQEFGAAAQLPLEEDTYINTTTPNKGEPS